MDLVKTLRLANWVSVAITVATGCGLWFIFRPTLPPQIPLFYGLPWGEAQLVPSVYLLIPTAISTLWAVGIGFGVGKLAHEKPLISIMLGSSIVGQVIAILAVLRLVLLVG